MPVIDWYGQQLVRVSVQAYSTTKDIEALLAGVADLLPKADEG